MSRGYKRRNFFIKKELQGRFIFKFFLLSLVGVVFFALVFSFLSQDNLTIAYDGQRLVIDRTPLILFREIVLAHWLFLVIMGVLVTAVAMFLTHRVAGPLFRFERTLGAMKNRDL